MNSHSLFVLQNNVKISKLAHLEEQREKAKKQKYRRKCVNDRRESVIKPIAKQHSITFTIRRARRAAMSFSNSRIFARYALALDAVAYEAPVETNAHSARRRFEHISVRERSAVVSARAFVGKI